MKPPKSDTRKQLLLKIERLQLDLQGSIERAEINEKDLKQRIQIDEYISTNKQQTLFAQLRAVEARLHLALTVLELREKRSFTSEKNAIYAQEYLNLIKSKVLV